MAVPGRLDSAQSAPATDAVRVVDCASDRATVTSAGDFVVPTDSGDIGDRRPRPPFIESHHPSGHTLPALHTVDHSHPLPHIHPTAYNITLSASCCCPQQSKSSTRACLCLTAMSTFKCVSLLLAALCLFLSVVSVASAPVAPHLPAAVFNVTTFNLTHKDDIIVCLTSDAASTTGFAVSALREVFIWPLNTRPHLLQSVLPPVPENGDHDIVACQANAAATLLYIIDARADALLKYNVSTPSIPPVILTSFKLSDHGLTDLAIDHVANMAYISTRYSLFSLFSVNLTDGSIYQNNEVPCDISALALSHDRQTLYYSGTEEMWQVVGSINSLPVNAGDIPDSYNSTLIYASSTDYIEYVTALTVLNSTHLLFSDGGPMEARQECEVPFYDQRIRTVSLSGGISTAYTTQRNLPSGLVFSSKRTEVLFTTDWCVGAMGDEADFYSGLLALPLSDLNTPAPAPISSASTVRPAKAARRQRAARGANSPQ